jgi:hypothetical protein
MVLQWMKEGRIRNVMVVFGGRKQMLKAGFKFTSYQNWEK